MAGLAISNWVYAKKSDLQQVTQPKTPLPETAYLQRSDSDLQGNWVGILQAEGMGGAEVRLPILVRMAELKKGLFAGELDTPEQGSAATAPITSLSYKKPYVRFETEKIGGKYEGALSQSGTELAGTWTQFGKKYPLNLERTDEVEEITPPTAKDAYAFISDSEPQGIWRGTLSGLHLVLKVTKTAENAYGAWFDVIEQNLKDVRPTTFTFTNGMVRMDWEYADAVYSGELENGKLNGTWVQHNATLPLDFERTQAEVIIPPTTKDAYASIGDSEPQGIWNGTLGDLHLVLKVTKTGENVYSAWFDVIEQNARDVPATAFTFTNGAARMEWDPGDAIYTGKLENGKLSSKLIGTWKQHGITLPLEFERAKPVPDKVETGKQAATPEQ